MSEPRIDAGDIQGHILVGFPVRHSIILGFQVAGGQETQAASVLAASAHHLTSTLESHQIRERRHYEVQAGQPPAPIDGLLVSLALGAGLLGRLGFDPAQLGNPAFVRGMQGLPALLPASDGLLFGSADKPSLDVLLILASDSEAELRTAEHDWTVRFDAVGERIYRERCERDRQDREPFGFLDGLSQPAARGILPNGDSLSRRYFPPDSPLADVLAKPGQRLSHPGQFIFGYGGPGGRPEQDPLADSWCRNGSLLVLWRLRQDKNAFEDFCRSAAQEFTDKGCPMNAQTLAAMVVGREPDGRPLVHSDDRYETLAPQAIRHQYNYFEYDRTLPEGRLLVDGQEIRLAQSQGDPLAERCPIWAHTRKMNPRSLDTDLGDAQLTAFMQPLRRGVPFVHQPGDGGGERGLLFMSYQTSLASQFIALVTRWANSELGPEFGGHDMLIGGLDGRELCIRLRSQDGRPIDVKRRNRWVFPTGGAFLFSPSVSFLARLQQGHGDTIT